MLPTEVGRRPEYQLFLPADWRTQPELRGVPAGNFEGAVIGFIGVVPGQRGAGYGRDLLAEATHVLAAEGADRIRADTDSTNAPMAAAFERAGYRHFGVQIVMA